MRLRKEILLELRESELNKLEEEKKLVTIANARATYLIINNKRYTNSNSRAKEKFIMM